MYVLFETFLPVAFGATDVNNVAVSTIIFVNDTCIEGYWKFVFKVAIGWKIKKNRY